MTFVETTIETFFADRKYKELALNHFVVKCEIFCRLSVKLVKIFLFLLRSPLNFFASLAKFLKEIWHTSQHKNLRAKHKIISNDDIYNTSYLHYFIPFSSTAQQVTYF